jgi:hypothetical protein
MGGISYGSDSFAPSYDPYIPILNEPMGRDFEPINFKETDLNTKAVEKKYEYIPLTYATPSASYLDSWKPIIKTTKEKMENFALPTFDFNSVLLFMFLIVIVYLMYKNYKTNKKIIKLLKRDL